MDDGLQLCTAAFFRSRGKTVVTENEFLMGVSMNMRWMPYSDAEKLLSLILKSGLAVKDGEYIRPKFDVGAVDVPVGYKPNASILSAPVPEVISKSAVKPVSTDPFQTLLAEVIKMGVDRKELLSRCRIVQKKMDIDIEATALLVLREMDVNVSGYIDEMYRVISER